MEEGNHPPLVSIITPTYNHEKFIGECIESVISQTWPDWEMIIADDGSTDHTAGIVESYERKDSRIHFIRQSNVGIFRLAETYNKALSYAKGEYVAILEGDDLWNPDKLEIQMEGFLNNPEAILGWGQAQGIDHKTRTIHRIFPDPDSKDYHLFENNPAGSILNILFFRMPMPALTVIVRKKALDDIGGFRQCCGLPLIDIPTFFELSLRGRFFFTPSVLGSWRIYTAQVTKTYTAAMMEGYREFAGLFYQRIKNSRFLDKSVNEQKIKSHFYKQLIISYSRSGRYKLIRKDFAGARNDYFKSLIHFGFREPLWKIRSLAGILLSFFHSDVEGLARFLGRKSYS